ncbi:MAG TPA: prepilin-type N-terminal cleavage/methylation domain-containing protein [Pseudomonadota bacterium]|nr:prepilin-type N-terminal cleavage/methylation domain-containing protein [Xanthomonadales bacterium]HQW81516.1 prepilin-type N-terminal cleavage/methylation domain-containing protein [Pseudomonadota bacterium]
MSRSFHSVGRPSRQSGLSLIELMISIVLGLLIAGAAVSMFLSFSRTYTASESLSRIQENARISFELMSRDMREAGSIPCSRYLPVVNVLNGADGSWWNTWGSGLVGYDNGTFPGSLAGTDAVQVISGASSTAFVSNHAPVSATFTVAPASHGFVANDVLMVCDYRQASIFQMTGGSGNSVVHNNSGTPGNCSKGLGFKKPRDCSATGAAYTYPDNSVMVRLQATRWYVAANGRGSNSLFRVALRGSTVGAAEEVVEGVSDMQLTFLLPGSSNYVVASSIPSARWRDVIAMRMDLGLSGIDRVGTDNSVITRRVVHTVTLRSRNA